MSPPSALAKWICSKLPTAYSLLPTRFGDNRHGAIEDGLRANGYRVAHTPPPGDVFHEHNLTVTWNAYGNSGKYGDQIERVGGRALVCEEAYIRNIKGEKYFSLALGGHNGFGRWNIGGPERWDSWGIEFDQWREDGDAIVVCGQRGFGYNVMAMPDTWPDTIHGLLREKTKRPIYFRAHPKRRRRMPVAKYDKILDWEQPLEDQLAGAWACVVWTSASACTALRMGIPTFFCGPNIVTEPGCHRGLNFIEQPALSDESRLHAFRRMAWAQWSMSEIKSGAACKWLLTIR